MNPRRLRPDPPMPPYDEAMSRWISTGGRVALAPREIDNADLASAPSRPLHAVIGGREREWSA